MTRYFWLKLVLLSLLPFALLLYLNSHLELVIYKSGRQTHREDTYRLPSADELALVGFNHRTALADVIWIDFILFTAQQEKLRRSRLAGTEYAEAIIYLDPYFHPVYQWHNSFRLGGAVRPTIEDRDAANQILATGLEYFPNDWRMAQSIVVNNISHHFGRTGPDRLADLEEALYFARLGAQAPGAPDVMLRLSTSLQRRLSRAREGLPELGDSRVRASPEELDFLYRRFLSESNPERREFLRYRLIEFGVEDDLFAFLHENELQLQKSHRRTMHYLSPDSFIMFHSGLYSWDESEEIRMPLLQTQRQQ